MRRKRLGRKKKTGLKHRLSDAEHNFFKAVHHSGHDLETYLDKKWSKLSLKQQHEIVLGAQIGAAAGATVATAGIGGFPLSASMIALGYTGAKGIRFSVDELTEKYEHWKKAHGLK